MINYKYLIITILTLNLIVFLTYALDKFLAIMHWKRVSEKRLHTLTILCGGAGALLGMIIFNHKTRKPIFWRVAIAALVVQGVVICGIVSW